MDIVDPMRIYHRYCVQVMKDDLGSTLRTHGPETTNGYLLVIFLSTVLHSKIRSLLRVYQASDVASGYSLGAQ